MTSVCQMNWVTEPQALVISDKRLRGPRSSRCANHVKATIRRGTQTGLRPTIDRAAKAEVLGFETCKGRKGETNLHSLLVGVGQF